jgi:hypothetical protein
MKTDALIRALASDTRPAAPVERYLALALVPATLVTLAVFLAVMGWRGDIARVAGSFEFLMKFVIALTLAGTALLLLRRLVQPASAVTLAAIPLAAAPVILAGAVLMEFAQVAPEMRAAKAVGTTWATCITSIPLISAPILIAALYAARHGAALRPALAGAVAGLLAAGVGAAIYALYCVEDSALFFLTWYTTAVAVVAAAGAIAGARLLRW